MLFFLNKKLVGTVSNKDFDTSGNNKYTRP